MRDNIIDYIKKELIGPDPIKPHIQENGEEILIEPPRLRYGAGILFPKAEKYVQTLSNSDEESSIIESNQALVNDLDEAIKSEDKNILADSGEEFEEEIGLSNSFLPSAMGFSCLTKIPKKGFSIKVFAATYEIKEYSYIKENGKTFNQKAYFRVPHNQEILVLENDLPKKNGESIDILLRDKIGKEIPLKLNIRNRSHAELKGTGQNLLTFTLINSNSGGNENIKNEACFFQVSFEVKAIDEITFYPYKTISSKTDKEDEKSNLLLFRNKKTFAVGHGCSPKWDDNDVECTASISTESIPVYEIKPIVPRELESVQLKMYDLSDLSTNDISINLNKLNSEYELWINKQEEFARKELVNNEDLLKTAIRHIDSCRECLKRMQNGVNLLINNPQINRAFKLMNRAMLLQQLRYSIETRNWKFEKGKTPFLDSNIKIPNINDQSTWKQGLGSWRPFQLAFVLMNLDSMHDARSEERNIVDLIWFPTGGGKTEAYLGLSAFTIFLKRLKNQDDSGTTVLMRYTLRLLTAQQFQRAASLICACDKIRDENISELGIERITIGLWVGELTPNDRESAKLAFQKLEQNREEENPFIVLKCPWCGTQMGLIKDAKNNILRGYRRKKINNKETIVYQCDNVSECDFSTPEKNLPLIVIDEDIYETPPTLLIGTVDKFAMLTWKPSARKIFGFRDENRLTPPELIIQDELHLISGPLGSMVGLYETMIEELCTYDGIKPKIIASSATISRAKEQINSLYGRGIENVNIFPAQCLNSGDSFFAFEDKESPGRYYAGIFASALQSHATAQVRLVSSLLQSIKSISTKDESQKDPYWTLLAYFNSIRELGHAATLIRADISEYLNSIWSRKLIVGDERRFINRDIELTSRMNSNDIPEYLEQLSKSYTGNKLDFPVDVCLASNMISVGVDIPRLGLMTVIGQPKTTSEYIQATSRVGRSKKGPGLIFTIYNCSKPRDRSHFEHFQEYHSKIYSKVEPTSVTPFSAPARERALHAILIGLIRFYSEQNRDKPKPFPSDEIINRVTKLIYDRVNLIEPEEFEQTYNLIEERLSYWKNELPIEYGGFGIIKDDPLMYPAGTNPPQEIKERAWSTPTSMRNVDSTCDAIVITGYLNSDK